jgi:hypothetical protein
MLCNQEAPRNVDLKNPFETVNGVIDGISHLLYASARYKATYRFPSFCSFVAYLSQNSDDRILFGDVALVIAGVRPQSFVDLAHGIPLSFTWHWQNIEAYDVSAGLDDGGGKNNA